MVHDLDHLLRIADPGNPNPAAVQAAQTLASEAAAVAAESGRTPRSRRIPRPALIGAMVGGLVLTGGVAAATPAVLDFFSTDSPVVDTVRFDVPGADASCTVFLNVVPADGAEYTDTSGQVTRGGSADTFDRADFDAVESFLRTHDWTGLIAEEDPFAGTTAGSDGEGATTMQGSFTGISAAVEQVLGENGLNTTGSAILVESAQCGVGTGS